MRLETNGMVWSGRVTCTCEGYPILSGGFVRFVSFRWLTSDVAAAVAVTMEYDPVAVCDCPVERVSFGPGL